MKDSTINNRTYVVISSVILLLLWKILSVIVAKSIIIPSPEETFLAFVQIASSKVFYLAILNTMKRVVLGFAFSFILALVLGLLAGFVDSIYHLLKPLILIQKAIPTMAIILVALIWLNSELAPILVGFLVVFPVIYGSVVTGIRSIDQKLLEMTKVYRLSLYKKLTRLYIPSIRDSLLMTVSTTLSLNLKIIVAAEVLSQPRYAIGTSFQIEKATLNTAGVFAWAIITILIATLFDVVIRQIQKKVVH